MRDDVAYLIGFFGSCAVAVIVNLGLLALAVYIIVVVLRATGVLH